MQTNAKNIEYIETSSISSNAELMKFSESDSTPCSTQGWPTCMHAGIATALSLQKFLNSIASAQGTGLCGTAVLCVR